MADRMIMITWGEVVRGREERALDIFNQSLGIYGRMQQDGRIESFDVKILAPNAKLGGYAELKGSAAQLAAAKEDAEFRRLCANAVLIVEEFNLLDGYCDEGVADEMAFFQEAISQVPQTA